jgi:hypothetical protein
VTFDKLKGIAELVGIMAIVLSLVFVGMELRQTQEALTAAALQSRAELQMSETTSVSDSEYMPAIFAKIAAGQSLDSAERWRFRFWARGYHRMQELTVIQYEAGILEDWALEEVRRTIRRTLGNQGLFGELMREEWSTYEGDFAPSYQKMVNANLDGGN